MTADPDYPFPDYFLAGMYLEFVSLHGHEVDTVNGFRGVPERYLHRRIFPEESFEEVAEAMKCGRTITLRIIEATDYLADFHVDRVTAMKKADALMMASFEVAARMLGLRFKFRSSLLFDKDGVPYVSIGEKSSLRLESLFVGAKVCVVEDALPVIAKTLPEGDYTVAGEVVEMPDGHVHIRWPHMPKDAYACLPPMVLTLDQSSLN